MAFAFQSIPPVIPLIIEDLNISHAQAGLVMGFYFIPGIFLSILVGFLADKYKAKNIIILSLVLIILGSLIVSFSPSYVPVISGRLVAGIGALSTSIVIPLIVSRWFIGKELGLSMSIFHTGVPMGSVLSFNIMPALARTFGWRSSQWFTAIFAFIALVIFLLFFMESPAEGRRNGQTGKKSLSDIARIGTPIWLLGMVWMLYTASISSFLNFSTDFLVRNGFSITKAGFASGMIPMIGLFSIPVVGLLIDKFHAQKLFIASAGAGIAILFVLIYSYPQLSVLLISIMGLFSALVPTSVTTSVPLYVAADKMGLAFGLTNTLSNAGGIITPYAAGFLRDFSGSYQMSFWLFSFLCILITFFIFVLVLNKYRTVND